MEKYLYTVGEVAGILGESTSLVRFWANEFPKFISIKFSIHYPVLILA